MSFGRSAFKKAAGKIGFTLAEVLVALTIVGIVAATVIPAIISRTNDAESIIKFKQVVSDLSAATKKLETTNGTIPSTNYGELRGVYKTVMNYIKEEDEMEYFFNKTYLCYKSSSVCQNFAGNSGSSILLSNGVAINLDESTPDCTDSFNNLTSICGWMAIDVNGVKGPNMEGKDFFWVWLVRKNNTYAILPMGSGGDELSCVIGSTDYNTSDGCATNALLNNLP